MKLPIFTLSVFSMFLLTACGNSTNNQASTTTIIDTMTTMSTDTASEKTYEVSLMDNKKDPTCGMPITAGISDTAHYKNKIVGFCSSECKAAFLKNPEDNIAAAELKK